MLFMERRRITLSSSLLFRRAVSSSLLLCKGPLPRPLAQGDEARLGAHPVLGAGLLQEGCTVPGRVGGAQGVLGGGALEWRVSKGPWLAGQGQSTENTAELVYFQSTSLHQNQGRRRCGLDVGGAASVPLTKCSRGPLSSPCAVIRVHRAAGRGVGAPLGQSPESSTSRNQPVHPGAHRTAIHTETLSQMSLFRKGLGTRLRNEPTPTPAAPGPVYKVGAAQRGAARRPR